MKLTIETADPSHGETPGLIQCLDEYLSRLYPAESNHLLSIEALKRPEVTFLLANVDGLVGGCSALVRVSDYVEFKRLYVRPEFRGLGIGRALVRELEARAIADGFTLARLETGISQPEALRLFETSGYTRRGPFGKYPNDPYSVFFEKTLAS